MNLDSGDFGKSPDGGEFQDFSSLVLLLADWQPTRHRFIPIYNFCN